MRSSNKLNYNGFKKTTQGIGEGRKWGNKGGGMKGSTTSKIWRRKKKYRGQGSK